MYEHIWMVFSSDRSWALEMGSVLVVVLVPDFSWLENFLVRFYNLFYIAWLWSPLLRYISLYWLNIYKYETIELTLPAEINLSSNWRSIFYQFFKMFLTKFTAVRKSQDLRVQSPEKRSILKKSGKLNINSGKIRILPFSLANVKK